MRRLVCLFTLVLTFATTSVCGASARAAEDDHELRTRLADRAAELRKRRVSSPKMGARHRSALNAEVASIDEALALLDSGGHLSAERVAQLSGEEPMRRITTADRIARIEARLDHSHKLGVRERQRLEERVEVLRAGETLVAESTPSVRALELERATLKRRLVSGPKLGQRERSRMRDRVEEIDRRLARLKPEENRLQVTESD